MTGSAALAHADPALAASLERGLALVETRLHEIVRSSHPFACAGIPLMSLNAAIVERAPASNAASKGGK